MKNFERMLRDIVSLPGFLPVTLAVIGGLVLGILLSSFGQLSGTAKAVVILLYSVSIPGAVVLSIRGSDFGRALFIGCACGALGLMVVTLGFSMVGLDPSDDLHSNVGLYACLLCYFAGMLRQLKPRSKPRNDDGDDARKGGN